MNAPRLSEDVVPIAEFKSHAARWLKLAATTSQPVVITQNGRPAGVIVSPAEFDRIQDQERFFLSITSGLQDADAGQVLDTRELRRQLLLRRSAEVNR